MTKKSKGKPCCICGKIFTPDRVSREVCDNERCLKIYTFNCGISNRYWAENCKWCKTVRICQKSRKYCSAECRKNFAKMRKLIKSKFSGRTRTLHLSLLDKLGHDYQKVLELWKIAEKGTHS